ncbi:MAG: hypothetical protein WDO18_06420 [Acidobacteriota bacterium]
MFIAGNAAAVLHADLTLESGGVSGGELTGYESPHPDPVVPEAELYRDNQGMVRLCAHCRRTKDPEEERWDWVPAILATLPAYASHGLCPFCRAYHYPAPHPAPSH